jgi:hypothetical protein
MAYPAPFHRIVIGGTLYGDIFNTTVSMIPGISGSLPAATQALADDLRTFISAWWVKGLLNTPGNGIGITSSVKLTSIKVNRIATTGHYQDPVAIESVLTTPLAGANSGTYAPQLAIVGSLIGASPRALAGKGRQYWPPNVAMQSLGTDGHISQSNAQWFALGLSAFYAGLNDVYLARSINSVVGIASDTRSGAFQALKTIKVGRTIDTMRSRRNKVPELAESLNFG